MLTVKESERCKLYCNVLGSSHYSLLKKKVIDGTSCGPDTYDKCVNGRCLPAGCDHVLYSEKRPDSCGFCGGDNSTCDLVTGQLNQIPVHYGYNSIFAIPKGAANIEVIQQNASPQDQNYLAIKADNGDYLLNGGMIVSLSKKTIQYAGTVIEYSGSNQTIEKFNTSKPIHRPIYVEVLSAGDLALPEIRYRYSSKKSKKKKCFGKSCSYRWQTSNWSSCSKSCDIGYEGRLVTCQKASKFDSEKWRRKVFKQHKSLEHFCNQTAKPKAFRPCNLGRCNGDAFWRPQFWGPVSILRLYVKCFYLLIIYLLFNSAQHLVGLVSNVEEYNVLMQKVKRFLEEGAKLNTALKDDENVLWDLVMLL